MRRILLALFLLATAGACFWRLSGLTERARRDLQVAQTDWLSQTGRVAEARTEAAALSARLEELRQQSQNLKLAPPESLELAALIRTNGLTSISPEAGERLLGQLGLDWHASTNYVLLSKGILKDLAVNTFQDGKLSEVACAVLAVTPEERQHVESALAETREAYAAWAKTNLQCAAPDGGTLLARVTIPANLELAQALTKDLFSAMNAALGSERGQVLQTYADAWLHDTLGYFGGHACTLAIMRNPGDPIYYQATYEMSPLWPRRHTESGTLAPGTEFPALFQVFFPGGWQEILQRANSEDVVEGGQPLNGEN